MWLVAVLWVICLGPTVATAIQADLAIRIAVTEEGVYRLTGADLEATGLTLDKVDVNSLNLYYGGGTSLDPDGSPRARVALERMDIAIEGGAGGRLDRDDTILFYGQATDRWERGASGWEHQRHPYTSTNTYWLCVGDTEAARRASASSGDVVAGETARTSYTLRLHAESEVAPVWVASGNIRSGRDWYWQALETGRHHAFTAVARTPVPGPARLRVAGYITSESEQAQRLHLRWNGLAVEEVRFAERGQHVAELVVPKVEAGVNELDVVLVSGDGVLLDWYELAVPHVLAADQDELYFDGPDTVGSYTYRVRGFGEAPRIYKVSSHSLTELVDVEFLRDEGAVVFADRVATPGPRYALVTDRRLRTPRQLELGDTPGLPALGSAEYVIITHGDFVGEARRLAGWRAVDDRFGPPPRTAIVDVADVYESYSGGLLDPTAIRNFLYAAVTTWDPAPQYVVLFGDGSYDYRDNSGLGSGQWVPPYEDEESTYDDWYARVEGNDAIPDLAIGRLPVQTATDAATVVDKLIAYDREPEPGPWRGRILLVADDTYNADLPHQVEELFTADAESLADSLLPTGLDLDKLYLVDYPRDGRYKPRARDAFLERLTQGAVLLTWVGHGNARVFAHEHIFVVSTDLASVANGRRLPFVYTAASQMGVFDDPLRDSIPEALLKWPGGGAIGMIAATRIGFHASNMDLARRFHERLFRSGRAHVPVGQALLEAKRETSANRENVQRYSLFGDPLTRLAIPELSVELEGPDTLRALGVSRVAGRIVDPAGDPVSGFDGQVHLQVFDSASLRRVTEQGVLVEYERPGVPVFRSVATVRDGRFSASFPVPKDITYRGTRGRISAFAWTGTRGAFGALEHLVVAGTDAAARADSEGPEISLGFAGQDFGDGDFVSSSPVLQIVLRDSSGINITGEVGHHIVVAVDGLRRQVTELYQAGEDFREGGLQVDLPDLTPGPHQVEVEAWDTHNNWSTAAVDITVGATDGVVLRDVLFHPNPMARVGHFSYSLSSPAERVEISLFSLAGRRVARLAAPGRMGHNLCLWQPDPVPAGGTYIYRIAASTATGERTEARGALQIAP